MHNVRPIELSYLSNDMYTALHSQEVHISHARWTEGYLVCLIEKQSSLCAKKSMVAKLRVSAGVDAAEPVPK